MNPAEISRFSRAAKSVKQWVGSEQRRIMKASEMNAFRKTRGNQNQNLKSLYRQTAAARNGWYCSCRQTAAVTPDELKEMSEGRESQRVEDWVWKSEGIRI
ncbi:hypothetical protein M9H77_26433 [Catharanthus roseus]|uniref:Uncharacterized protein n=1 Tax=Catharanthus roseus TaxID=4058 RepID=A0ACC0A9S1_CATRO|nr:hypothetical protein M9H77_26433 [Catharanthus roseus]